MLQTVGSESSDDAEDEEDLPTEKAFSSGEAADMLEKRM